jgi:NADPH:quinone reductase-like Zn-dependent oxidoreductase
VVAASRCYEICGLTLSAFVDQNRLRALADAPAGAGVDLAFDPVAGPELERVAETMRSGGMIFVYGALSPAPTPFPLFAAIEKNLILRGYSLFSIVLHPERGERTRDSLGLRPDRAREIKTAHRPHFQSRPDR